MSEPLSQSEQIDKAFEVERKIVMEVVDTQLEFAQMMSKKMNISIDQALETYTDLEMLNMGLILPPEVKNRDLTKSFLEENKKDDTDWLLWAKNVALHLRTELEGEIKAKDSASKQIGNLKIKIGVADQAKAERYHLNEYDNFVDLHLPILAVQKEYGQAQESWVENMQKIARKIVEEAPQTKWLLGKSWIINHPNASLIGFEKVHELQADKVTNDTPRVENPFKGATYWLQMVDKDGEIKHKYVDQLMKNGKLPYEVGFGRIDTVDFLKKFLPQEMRGNITLKVTTPEYIAIMSSRDENREAIRESWPLFEGMPIGEFIKKKIPVFADVLYKIGKFDLFVEILNKGIKENKSLEELDLSDEVKEFSKDLNEHLKSVMYKERVVVID